MKKTCRGSTLLSLALALPFLASADTISNVGATVVPTALTTSLAGPLLTCSGTFGSFAERCAVYVAGSNLYAFVYQFENLGMIAAALSFDVSLPNFFPVSVFDHAMVLPATGIWGPAAGADPTGATRSSTDELFSFSSAIAAGGQTSQFGYIASSLSYCSNCSVITVNNLSAISPGPVGAQTPEPMSLLLAGLGLGGVVLRRRKQRA